ncbi:Arginine-specific demethylase JMJ20 [Linum grandiflorum]
MEKSTMGLDIQGEIDKVNGKDLSYNEFADNYLAKNRPVLLTGLMEDWRACRDWVTADGLPNLEFFSTHFAKSRVQVADCGTREFSDQKRVEMTVAEFIDHWINKDGLTEGSGESVLYLKDWHFVKEDTISINHNWFNGHNLSWVFDLLLRDYKEAKEYIEDIRDISDDFEGLCQRNLAANTGMNFVDFFVFLLRFFLANLVQVFHQQIDSKSSASTPSELTQHFTFNSSTIRKMAVKMEQSVDSLAGYPGFTTNLRETLDDPEFLKLCIDVGKTYGTIHDQKSSSSDASKYQINEIMDAASHILRTKGFVKFIDFALEKLSSKG